MDCEVIVQRRMALRGEKMLKAMVDAAEGAGVRVTVTDKWRRQAPVLMSYGLGHPERRIWTRAHVKAGGRLVGFDLGYWLRDEPLKFNMRMTIDDEHPHRWIEPAPPDRFDATGIELREHWDPMGPIVLCGLGQKQRSLMGFAGQAWEHKTLRSLRERYGKRRVIYRPKRPEVSLPGCALGMGPIEEVIKGAALVACHHSNVAVDACIAGVPVECEDGAAFALYRGNPAPSRAQRLEFLRSLAWWQWNPMEAAQCWQFLKARLSV